MAITINEESLYELPGETMQFVPGPLFWDKSGYVLIILVPQKVLLSQPLS